MLFRKSCFLCRGALRERKLSGVDVWYSPRKRDDSWGVDVWSTLRRTQSFLRARCFICRRIMSVWHNLSFWLYEHNVYVTQFCRKPWPYTIHGRFDTPAESPRHGIVKHQILWMQDLLQKTETLNHLDTAHGHPPCSPPCPCLNRQRTGDSNFMGRMGVWSRNSCVSIAFNVAIPIHLSRNS